MDNKIFIHKDKAVIVLIFVIGFAIFFSCVYGISTVISIIPMCLTMVLSIYAYQTYKINLVNYNISLISKRCEIYKVIIEILYTVSTEGYLPKDIYLKFKKAKLESKAVFEEREVLQYIEDIHKQVNHFINYKKDKQEDKENFIRANFSKQLLECDRIFERHLHYSEP